MPADAKKPEGKASKYFTWAELLLLPSWGIYHDPTEEQRANLIKLANKMDKVREFLGAPINVNCCIRPPYVFNSPTSLKNYNVFVQGAPNSAHLDGRAIDFTVSGMTCDEVRFHLIDKLEEFNMRMERKDHSRWVHLGDDWAVGKTRYFIP